MRGQCGAGCPEFSMEELENHLRRLAAKKAPGPDGITNEHLRHLGPAARRALPSVINNSWLRGDALPSSPSRAGKDEERVARYRPIVLTSHVSKLERLILARLPHIADLQQMIPAEQVGFRVKMSVEDNIGRLVQQVRDGWNRPKARAANSRTVPALSSMSCWPLTLPGRTTPCATGYSDCDC